MHMKSPTRYSPIHTWSNSHGAKWGTSGDGLIALSLGDAAVEKAAVQQLALCDISGLAKLGLKGAASADWLRSHGISVPTDVFAVNSIDSNGLIARHGNEEFFLEDGFGGAVVTNLSKQLAGGLPGVYRVERHDGTFVLCGSRAKEVLAQTTGINFSELPQGRVIFTRAAGVNCCILPKQIGETVGYQLWVDPSYAFDLWHSLEEILSELGGKTVGIEGILPLVSYLVGLDSV